MTDKQYDVMEAWAKSQQRTVENLMAMFVSSGSESSLFTTEACVLKIEGDRDQSRDTEFQYYTDTELTKLYEFLALQQDRS
jgi:hypothetical protein